MLNEYHGQLLAEGREAEIKRHILRQALLREAKAAQAAAAAARGGYRARGVGALVAQMRRSVGGGLVAAGQWLQGAQGVGARPAYAAARLPGARLVSTPAGAALVVECDALHHRLHPQLRGRPAVVVVQPRRRRA